MTVVTVGSLDIAQAHKHCLDVKDLHRVHNWHFPIDPTKTLKEITRVPPPPISLISVFLGLPSEKRLLVEVSPNCGCCFHPAFILSLIIDTINFCCYLNHFLPL